MGFVFGSSGTRTDLLHIKRSTHKGVIPTTRVGKIEFYESHLAAWAANAEQIGLTSAQVLALQTLTMNARSAWLDAETAREASKSATQTFHNNADNMATIGSNLIRTIRAYAETNQDPAVYTLAQIPAPAEPAPVGPPGQPYDLSIGLAATGAVILGWKCDNPSGASGTVYEIQRRIGQGPFEFVELAGEKLFEDNSIPAGSSGLVYQITAVRGKTRGAAAQFLVNFGSGSGTGSASGMTATPIPAGDMKIAASGRATAGHQLTWLRLSRFRLTPQQTQQQHSVTLRGGSVDPPCFVLLRVLIACSCRVLSLGCSGAAVSVSETCGMDVCGGGLPRVTEKSRGSCKIGIWLDFSGFCAISPLSRCANTAFT